MSDDPANLDSPGGDYAPNKARRVPWTLHALVVIGVVVIVVSPQVVWLLAVSLRPESVGEVPPISEAVRVSAVTGLFGLVGGAALANTVRGGRG